MSMVPECSHLRRPIGVFDSGVGGLTVLNALQRKFPSSDFIYFADTARVPYGRKPKPMVREYALQILQFLLEQSVARVIVACNTACASALPELIRESPVPVTGVIEPSVEAAARATRTGHVGVIGTKATIASQAYQSLLESQGLTTWAQACPMLVHLVEEGLVDTAEAELLVSHYMAARPDVDTVILGCTHYPFLRRVIQRVVGGSVTLISCADAVSDQLAGEFSISAPPEGRQGRTVHCTTGDPTAYRHTSAIIGSTVEGPILPIDVMTLHHAMRDQRTSEIG